MPTKRATKDGRPKIGAPAIAIIKDAGIKLKP
jgi:hypothetical protein